MVDRLAEQVKKAYAGKAAAFFEKVKTMNLTDKELNAVPSLFIPGWGEDYDSSCLKVAIAGKETLYWGNEYGDSLKCDLKAYDKGKYDVLASNRRFREQGPSEWNNVFWQYPASALAKFFGCTRDDVLTKDNPSLRSIAWFNGHAIETYDSQGVSDDISFEKMSAIQNAADESGLSDFETFANVFRPHVIFYFYRNKSGLPERNFPSDIELVQRWADGIADEYRINGQTILLHCPHTTYFAHGNLKQEEFADIIQDIFKARNIQIAQCAKNESCDFYRMSATEWMAWVEFVRNEAEKFPDMDNMTLSHHLMAVVAKEHAKRHATMNAQTLVLILNEVDKFRQSNWQYSPERRGPCSCVRSGAIGNGMMTWIQTSLKKAGTVSFWWKAACEEPDVEDGDDGYYDYGAFMVDGNVVARLAGNDTGWQFFSTNITSGGKHVLRWEYSKDGAATYAPDCVWLDQVQWIPADGSGYTLTTPEPVPYAWLLGYGLGGGSDFETAAKGATGKRGGDGRALQVWQDHVAGTDPTNAADRFFKVSVEMP